MYKVMLVDDEKAIRSILIKTINWEEKGLQVVAEASSGIEAINTIDDVVPDIIFVDIRMPFMDGIEFAKLAIKRYPDLKIIMLTAFDDFSYAKQCIGIGVSDYILKPIVRDDINESLDKIINELKVSKPLNVFESENEKECSVKIEEVKEYIKNNYSNQTINLTSIAENMGYNPSYLSRKFKDEMGIGIASYLTNLRINKAKELAKEGMIMYMTADKVGVPDPNYFGKIFKKNVGVSYSDYLKKQDEKDV
ncbi:MAG: response regulator [Lachnospiraceae bacterium]|nr:response regulator [Lachnospiraceae bacterium]